MDSGIFTDSNKVYMCLAQLILKTEALAKMRKNYLEKYSVKLIILLDLDKKYVYFSQGNLFENQIYFDSF